MPSSSRTSKSVNTSSDLPDSQRKKVVISSLDGDDCLFHRHGYLAEESNVLEQNHLLFTHMRDQLKDKDKGKLYVGSNRQSLPIDILNSTPSGFGARKRPRRESFLKIFPMIAEVLKNASNKPVDYSRQLLPDIISSLPAGTTYYSALKEYEENPDITHGTPEYKYNHPVCPMDMSKILLLYSQIHDAALAYPDCDITFNFYDDDEEILRNLHTVYALYPNLIPRNISLNLFLYNGKEKPTPVTIYPAYGIGGFEKIPSTPLSGTGNVNHNYQRDIKSLFYLGIQEKVPEISRQKRKIHLGDEITADDSRLDFNAYTFLHNKEGVYYFLRHLVGDQFQPDEADSQDAYSPDAISTKTQFNHAYTEPTKSLATDGLSEETLLTHSPSFTETDTLKINTAVGKLKPSPSEPSDTASVADKPMPAPSQAPITIPETITDTGSPQAHKPPSSSYTPKGYSLVPHDIINKYNITIPEQVDLITNAINEANQAIETLSVFIRDNFKPSSKEEIARTTLLDKITNAFQTKESPDKIKSALIPEFQKAADALRYNKHGTNFLIFLAGCLDVILSIISLSIYAWVTGLKSNTLFFAQKTHNNAIQSKAVRSDAIQQIKELNTKTGTLVDALNPRSDNSTTPSQE